MLLMHQILDTLTIELVNKLYQHNTTRDHLQQFSYITSSRIYIKY